MPGVLRWKRTMLEETCIDFNDLKNRLSEKQKERLRNAKSQEELDRLFISENKYDPPNLEGRSTNQTFLPLMLWLIWLPPAQDCQDNRRRGGCKSINRLIILIRKGSLEGMFLSDFFFFGFLLMQCVKSAIIVLIEMGDTIWIQRMR